MTVRPDVSLIPIHGKAPRIHDSAFVAPGCRIIGDVEIGPDASIWYNCVLRGDVSRIVIGARTNVQDGTVIHCDQPMPGAPDGFPTLIGDDVLIGHMAMVHGTVIEDKGSKIEETKVRSHTQRIVVTPKVGTTRPYEILTGDGAPVAADISGSARTGTGQRVWQVLRF